MSQTCNAHDEYEFSTDEEAEFEYGVNDDLDNLDEELDGDQEGGEDDDDSEEEGYQGNPQMYSHGHHGQ